MNVTVRYFASLREVLGAAETLEVASGDTVGALREMLLRCSPAHATALDRKRALRCALNQTLCDESALLTHGAEVAFFPPVTGG
ncbi:MAG: molybdopterin converting factor subunit 1 [Burkholderiaceae bacterium]